MFQETVWNHFNIVMADLNVMLNSSIVGSQLKLFRSVPDAHLSGCISGTIRNYDSTTGFTSPDEIRGNRVYNQEETNGNLYQVV